MKPKLLTTKEVAERLGVSPSTVASWSRGYYFKKDCVKACKIDFIKPIHIGRNVRYKEAEFNRWLEAQCRA